MTPGNELVERVSDEVRIIRGMVEYDWLVGCVPTSVAIILGHWDRNGFDNLIAGDSSTYNANVKNAMASQGHYNDYYRAEGYARFLADPGQDRERHDNDSIADFLYSSRSDLGLYDGWTYADLGGVGLRGYAAHRGYEAFKTTYQEFYSNNDLNSDNFLKIADEIEVGRPVMLGVSGTTSGELNHSVVAFGYNSQTNQLLVHDGWGHSKEPIWIDFALNQPGIKFGIGSVTFVQPPDEVNTIAQDQYLVFDGPNIFDTYVAQGGFSATGRFIEDTTTLAQNLWGKASTGIASADGHVLYQLVNDGAGSTSLVKLLAHGDGQYSTILLNTDSGLDSNTIGLATADGKLFHQLVNDGHGTAALYEARLQLDGSFATTLLSRDSGAALNTAGLSTTDGKNFKIIVGGFHGNASVYDAHLKGNGEFSSQLSNASSGLSASMDGIVAWTSKPVPVDQEETGPGVNIVSDVRYETQYLHGSNSAKVSDIFQINGNSDDYDWGQTHDGQGVVLWNNTHHDLLYDLELIRFNDADISIADVDAANRVEDLAHITQYLTGQGENDIFVIDGYEQDYDWTKTLDGQGTVIWNDSGHDLLYGFERLQFVDGEAELAPIQPPANIVADESTQTQYLFGQSDRDVFRLEGASTEFGWNNTSDGGYVVWNLETKAHDLLYGFEGIEFDDSEFDLV